MKQYNNRTILHIDFDSFFASVEQQKNPLFREKPLGVTATNGRNCIIAASREAKRAGIKSPSRVYEAKRICPELLLIGAHFTQYWEISKQFISICKDYSPYVEVFSLDELFMDVTKTAHLFGGVDNLINRIKTRIRNEIGEYVTASFGISYNKLLAKLASGLHKPNGIVFITPQNREQIYKEAVLTDICGIGFRIEKRLNAMGIYTLQQLSTTPLPFLIAEFGDVEGHFLYKAGRGIDDRPIVPYTEAPTVKSVGRNYCLPHNEYDQRVVLQNVYELAEEIGIKLRRLSKKAKTIGLSLRGNRTEYGHYTSLYTDTGKDIYRGCKTLYDRWGWNKAERSSDMMVRQISVWTGNLIDSNAVTMSIFDTPKKNKLLKTIDALNERFGDHTIRNGFLLYADKLTTVPNGWGADRYERTLLTSI